MAIKDWRMARGGNNFAKGRSMILNINPVYKINKLVGYKITLFDMSKARPLQSGRVLKVTRTRATASTFAKRFMSTH